MDESTPTSMPGKTLEYGVSRRRVTRRPAVGVMLLLAVGAVLVFAHRPLLLKARRSYHSAGLSRAVRAARDAGGRADTTAMTAARTRMDYHRRGLEALTTGKPTPPVLPTPPTILMMLDRTPPPGRMRGP